MLPPSKYGRIQKSGRRKFRKQEVINIIQIMEQQHEQQASASNNSGTTDNSNSNSTNKDLKNEFFNTGRVGRRNALPDILGSNCTLSTADLPSRLSTLSTTDDKSAGEAGPSNIKINNTSIVPTEKS